MENNPNQLSLRQPIIYLGIFTLFMGVLIGAFSIADKMHKESVYNRYEQEANSYIAHNRQSLVKVFTEIFPNVESSCSTDNENTPCQIRNSQIVSLLPPTLKDWSSTMFLKKTATNRLLIMQLSGEVSLANIYPEEKNQMVYDLLSEKRDTVPWDTYSYLLNTKQVIIVVKDEHNTIVGALIRGTIE